MNETDSAVEARIKETIFSKPSWRKWADNWLSGVDRLPSSAFKVAEEAFEIGRWEVHEVAMAAVWAWGVNNKIVWTKEQATKYVFNWLGKDQDG